MVGKKSFCFRNSVVFLLQVFSGTSTSGGLDYCWRGQRWVQHSFNNFPKFQNSQKIMACTTICKSLWQISQLYSWWLGPWRRGWKLVQTQTFSNRYRKLVFSLPEQIDEETISKLQEIVRHPSFDPKWNYRIGYENKSVPVIRLAAEARSFELFQMEGFFLVTLSFEIGIDNIFSTRMHTKEHSKWF